MVYNKTIIFISLALMLGCGNSSDKTGGKFLSPEKKRFAEDYKFTTLIAGKTDDSLAFDYLNLLGYNTFNGKNLDSLIQNRSGDSIDIRIGSILEPQLIEVMSFGQNFHNFKVFVTPGDSVRFSIDKDKWEFTGKNSGNYNFFPELSEKIGEQPVFKGNFRIYKNQLDSIYKLKIKFLQNYLISHNNVSKSFSSEIQSEFKYEYLYNLIAPRAIKSRVEDISFNTSDGFYSVVGNNHSIREEDFLDVKEYFDNISIEDFKRPDLLNNDYFKRSIVEFIRFYFSNHEYLDYSLRSFNLEKKIIQDELDGELENYTMIRLMSDYHKKGFGYSIEEKEILKILINEYQQKTQNYSYLESLAELKEALEIYDSKFNEYSMDEELQNLSGEIYAFKKILNSKRNKIKVIDFWASWCAPCISEITKSNKFKDRLKRENDIEWIYISIDKQPKKWGSMTKKLRDDFISQNHFRILKKDSSYLLKFLNLTTIPRYVIIDSRNNLISAQAPRPSDSLGFEKIIQSIAQEQ